MKRLSIRPVRHKHDGRWRLWLTGPDMLPTLLPGSFRTRAKAREHLRTAAQFMLAAGLLSRQGRQ